jgi:hypothetical protein
MTVTVLAILETDFVPAKHLAKIMNDRLNRAAKELADVHLKALTGRGFSKDDLVVYLSYNPKFKIRYRIVNDVPADIEYFVAECCGRLGYILWRTNDCNRQGIRIFISFDEVTGTFSGVIYLSRSCEFRPLIRCL